MAYSDHHCACRGRKERETFLCPQCETHLADTTDMRIYTNEAAWFTQRRNAAIRLLAAARKRTSRLPLRYSA